MIFSNFSGLSPYPSKSAFYFSQSCGVKLKVAILGFLAKSLPIKHLGVLLVGRELRVADCGNLLDQIRAYFERW